MLTRLLLLLRRCRFGSGSLRAFSSDASKKTTMTSSSGVVVDRSKLQICYARSPGPGGQNVNKLNTKVDLRFVLKEADWLSEHAKERLAFMHPKKLNRSGEFIVTSIASRSQHRNLDDALQKLQDYVDEACKVPKLRTPTKAPVYAKEKRLQDKHKHSQKKQERRKPRADDF